MTVQLSVISDTSPAAPGTVVGSIIGGLGDFDSFRIDALLTGATGGPLDVYLQRELATNVWADWLHYTQIATGASAVMVTALAGASVVSADVLALTTIGFGTTAAPGVALAAGKFIGGHPGSRVRAVYVAGASTSAGAAQLIRFTCYRKIS